LSLHRKISEVYPRVLLTASLFLAATLQVTDTARAQSNGVAVVGGSIVSSSGGDFQLNYYVFLERVQHPWSCFLTGNGGPVDGRPDAEGLGWPIYKGPAVLGKVANPPYQYQISMYIGADLDSAYQAALKGCAAFEPVSLVANNYDRGDLRLDGEMLGDGPPTWIAVSGGFSTSVHSELRWGPQLEFIDADRDITDPDPDLAMSFCASPTAARYANLQYLRPDWNVFDLRQGLRQASTFYNSNGWGWRENGGYGFPLVPNQVGNNFIAASVPTNSDALDAGPPLQPAAIGKAGINGPQVSFRWYNFRQSTFDHTRIKIGDTNIDAPATALRYDWDIDAAVWPPMATNAEFFTVLANQKLSPPEIYTQVSLPLVLALPQFNSDAEFQFNVYAFPCTNVPTPSVPNPSVRVYVSTDLVSWSFLDALWLPDGKGIFRDSQVAGVNCRFYRILERNLHSQTIGFTRLTVAPSSSKLIANQFDRGDNSLASIFASSKIAAPITLTKQNPADTSSYDPTAQAWSNPSLQLSPGEAAWLYNPGPQPCVVRFTGDVREGGLVTSVSNNSPIVSFMLPIPLSSYPRYQRNVFGDPLGPGANLQCWNGHAFISYYNDPQNFAWTPQIPPVQPGEGFSITPGFPVPTNQPARWEMAFSALAEGDGYINQLRITSIRVQDSDVVVSYISAGDHYYRLEYTDDPSFSTWTTASSSDLYSIGEIVTFIHTGGAGQPFRFYRIRMVQ